MYLVDWSGGPSHDGKGNEFSAGLMFANAGNNETSKTSTMSKSLLLLLDEGEEVHLVALKNPDGKFPYQGHFITFCASLMEKKGTKAAFPGKGEDTYYQGKVSVAPCFFLTLTYHQVHSEDRTTNTGTRCHRTQRKNHERSRKSESQSKG